MSWNYRIVNCANNDGTRYFALFEVFYNQAGVPQTRTEEPATFACDEDEGEDGICLSLSMALTDALEKPALVDEKWFTNKKGPEQE